MSKGSDSASIVPLGKLLGAPAPTFDQKQQLEFEIMTTQAEIKEGQTQLRTQQNELITMEKMMDLHKGLIITIEQGDPDFIDKCKLKCFRVWPAMEYDKMSIVNVTNKSITQYSRKGIVKVPYRGWESKKWDGWYMQVFVDVHSFS